MSRLIGILVIATSFAVGWSWMDYRAYLEQPLGNEVPVIFEIAKGQRLPAIADALHQQGLVRKPLWFKLYALTSKSAPRLKFGEYEVPARMTLRELVAMLVSGKVRQHAITFVEGWRFRQVLEQLHRDAFLDHQLPGKSDTEIMGMLGIPGDNPEGLFYPDTYFFTKGMSDVALLQRAYRKMQDVLNSEWQARAQGLPIETPYQALILASIVEKETARPDERARIAGVFMRRLANGMLLQTDPTVIYGMGDAFQGDIRRDDLQRHTPYNTYVRPGLPPTPIASPGILSIHAVLHPEAGDSLYFVSRGDGTHVFSRTLEEHRKLVEQFQKPQQHD
ncbi:MAG: aminodeoxychorismate lyase [Proteobacteria bacterium]|nr:aminodeoxychorismate lyase [Pseudomonadota bacterium]